jgi:hypothetical protein
MLIVYLVIAAAGVTLLLNSFLTFDRLVKAEYAFNRTAWEADGKPNGFFWRAPERTIFGSDWARTRLSFAWLFTTPPWMNNSTDYAALLKRFRIGVLVWNIFGLVVILTMPFR